MAPLSFIIKGPYNPMFPWSTQLLMVPCICSHVGLSLKRVSNLLHSVCLVTHRCCLFGYLLVAFKMNYIGKKFPIRKKLISIEPAGSSHKILKRENCAVLNNEGQILLILGSLWQEVNDDKLHYCECQFKGWWESLLQCRTENADSEGESLFLLTFTFKNSSSDQS